MSVERKPDPVTSLPLVLQRHPLWSQIEAFRSSRIPEGLVEMRRESQPRGRRGKPHLLWILALCWPGNDFSSKVGSHPGVLSWPLPLPGTLSPHNLQVLLSHFIPVAFSERYSPTPYLNITSSPYPVTLWWHFIKLKSAWHSAIRLLIPASSTRM